jgi:hypothetical protein
MLMKWDQVRVGGMAGMLVALLVLAAVAHVTVAQADTIIVDPDGGGANGAIAVATFDYQPGNGIFANLGPAAAAKNNTPFTYYFQTRLANFLDGSSVVIPVAGLNQAGGFEITAVFAFQGIANGGGFPAPTSYSLAGSSYFQLFYDANPLTQADDLAGTGFDDGTPILSGSITQADGSYTVTPAAPLPLFDGFGPDNYGGLNSLVTTGGADLTVSGITIDPLFFATSPVIQLHLLNSSNISPFSQVNPSQIFQPNSAGLVPLLGVANGMGTDFQVQSDATGSFVVIPEPTSLMLLAVGGLGCLTYARRRRAAR